MAPLSDTQLLCPRGHGVDDFYGPTAWFSCDICGSTPEKDIKRYTCRSCPGDFCALCIQASSAELEADTAALDTAATDPPAWPRAMGSRLITGPALMEAFDAPALEEKALTWPSLAGVRPPQQVPGAKNWQRTSAGPAPPCAFSSRAKRWPPHPPRLWPRVGASLRRAKRWPAPPQLPAFSRSRQSAAVARSFELVEKELWRQLRRKRDFELRVAAKQKELDDLRGRRRSTNKELAEASASREGLQAELDFLECQGRELRCTIEELQMSRLEVHRGVGSPLGTSPGSPAQQGSPALQRPTGAWPSQASLHRHVEELQSRAEQLELLRVKLRGRLEEVFSQHSDAAKDRNRVLGVLHDESASSDALRLKRVCLAQERRDLEMEAAKLRLQSTIRGVGCPPP